MVTEKYNILQNQYNSDIALEDYNSISRAPNKTFKIGIIGTVLLCSNPNIYANEVKYKLKDKVTIESVQCAKEYSSYFDSYVDSVNGINKMNFSKREVITNILSFKSSYISIASENKKVGTGPLQQTTFSNGWKYDYHIPIGNASTISRPKGLAGRLKMERATGLEPATSSLGS